MPFENDSIVKSYAHKINAHKNGVDILIKLTMAIFQPELIPSINNALQNAHVQIRDRISIKDVIDLINVLYVVNDDIFKTYFTRLEEMIARNEISHLHVATLIEGMLNNKKETQILPLQCIPNLLLLVTKQLLKRLPIVEAFKLSGVFSTEYNLIAQLAVIIYRIDATQCTDFSKGLAKAVHGGEISYYQISVLIENLLDEEYKEKFSMDKNNTYLRSLNIITDLLVTIIPEEDRSTFIMLIFNQLFDFVKLIARHDLLRSLESGKKFSIREEKMAIIEGKHPALSKEFALLFQSMLDVLNKITIGQELLPRVVRMVCQIIAVHLNKKLADTENKERTVILFISSFITNKLCGDLITKWVAKTFNADSEALSAVANYIIKPLQHLVTYINLSEENKAKKELGLPKELEQLINEKNQQIFIGMSKRIVDENPPALLVSSFTAISANNNDGIVMANNIASSSSASAAEGKEKGVIEPIVALAMPSLAVISHSKPAASSSTKPAAILPIASEKKYLDKEIDEQELVMRLQIYYANCISLAIQINGGATLLPSQKNSAVKTISGFVPGTTAVEKVLPSARKILKDIEILKQTLAQNKSSEKAKLLDMYQRLHTAIVNHEAYKSQVHVDHKVDKKIAGNDKDIPSAKSEDRRPSMSNAKR